MAKFDPTVIVHDIDALLEQTDKPLHRQILENFRRHAILELIGEWEQIFTPDMTVEHPIYRMNEGGQGEVLDGMEAVQGFYKSLVEAGATNLVFEDNNISVNDRGIAIEAIVNHLLPGSVLAAEGAEVDDHDAIYNVRHRLGMFWPYDETGRLIGEHVYEDIPSREVIKLDPSEVLTAEEARAALLPLLRPLPTYEAAAA